MHPKLIGTQVGPVEFSKLGFNNLTYPKAQSILSTSEFFFFRISHTSET